ncbi:MULTISPECIES: cupin domain-containing protein [Burkholderia]|uniref:Putative cupin superfamily protein n=1 Tax=Burkholderia pyrrocinia TaxID=60550 RepID=A0A318IQH2_BURPY|nr:MULTISPECIES: cupin domain-containing protein [Burkholderia]PXX34884.1 putative cupin superfamily protein [Burkholderia pyrrocinia]SFW70051.1 Predicted enzyme of the cupin superfamily [Burkholderia sp. NFACC33-1]SFY30374.1 Predicted enzyme of the cupin superfamily [Burkholderia sp. NFPP32]
MTVAFVLHRADGTPLSTVFRRKPFGENDPFGPHREIAWEGPDSMAAGRIGFVGELDAASFPHIETIVVVAGELTLEVPGAAPLVLGPQAGAVIGSGTAVRVSAASPVLLMFCAAACTNPTRRGLFALRADADFKPSASLPADVLLGPAPQCRSDNVFVDDGADYCAGTWDSTPYHRIVRPHRVNEFMQLLAGSVRFAAPDGSVLSLGAGDALFVPRGAPVGWESSDRVAKFYVVQNVQVSTEQH